MELKKQQDKTIVITGGGSGLGRALAHKFYESGNFNVCLIGRNKKNLIETAKNFNSKKSLCLSCDIRNYQEVKKAFKKIRASFKKIDVLINNAGMFEMLAIEKTTPKIWDNILKTNAYGTFYCTKEAIKSMTELKLGGRIINILSIITEKDLPFNSAYAASKYAVKGFMNSLKKEVAGKNIYISNISPSVINTGIWNKKNKKLNGQSPEEVASIIYNSSTKKRTYVENISLLSIN